MMGKNPLDMSQYKKIFGTCRIPMAKRDKLSYNDTKYVTVMHNNHVRYFSLHIYFIIYFIYLHTVSCICSMVGKGNPLLEHSVPHCSSAQISQYFVLSDVILCCILTCYQSKEIKGINSPEGELNLAA